MAILFGALIYLKVPGAAMKALDARGIKVQAELDEALRLRQEAQALLAQIKVQREAAEKVAAELAWRCRRGATALPAGLASRFAVKPDNVPAVLRPLGFRVLPAAAIEPDQFGPPAPPMLMALRRRKPLMEQPDAVKPGPFAALAVLKLGGAR